MCGIVGLLNSALSKEGLKETCKAMTDALTLRGPDAEGIWIAETVNLGFGHRRLSIQDLTQSGAQPMHSASGRFTIVFNGEIYNFKSLRNELSDYPFRGDSDTEVILAAFESCGIEPTLKKLSGMFALAVFDHKNHTLSLARDRVGEKPLYYGWLNNSFFFASELKVIRGMQQTFPEIEGQALTSFFQFGYINAPLSIYKNIFKLPAAHFITLSTDQWATGDKNLVHDKLACYWNFNEVTKKTSSLSIQDAINALDEHLHRTIRNQMISDVPLGAFLSGGIDSSLVSAIMQSESQIPIQTFTIGFDSKSFDEAQHALAISKHLGTNHTQLYLSANNFLDAVPAMAEIYDEPFANGSQMAVYILSQLARSKVTVCLSGDGGDELFAGYNRYFGAEKVWNLNNKIPNPLRNLLSNALHTISPESLSRIVYHYERLIARRKIPSTTSGTKLHKLADALKLNTTEEIYLSLISYWSNPSSLLLDYSSCKNPTDIECSWLSHFIEKGMFWDFLTYLPGDSLTKVDRAAMANSLETRLPLLDHELIEFAWSLPLNYKFRENTTKWLLRQVLYKYVPRELVERPKMGFTAPLGEWLRGPLKSWGEDLIATDFIKSQNLFNPVTVEKTWKEHQSQRFDHGNKLWTLLMFQSWQHHWQ